MGKEIILPWTCETGDKIKSFLAISSLIGFPILTVMILYFGLNYHRDYLTSELYALGFVLSLLGSILLWFAAFTLWGFEELLPHFVCKQQNLRADKQ